MQPQRLQRTLSTFTSPLPASCSCTVRAGVTLLSRRHRLTEVVFPVANAPADRIRLHDKAQVASLRPLHLGQLRMKRIVLVTPEKNHNLCFVLDVACILAGVERWFLAIFVLFARILRQEYKSDAAVVRRTLQLAYDKRHLLRLVV